jgi:hypothetical protein
MRMWNVPPRFMCDRHLNGEHRELHMMAVTLSKRLVPEQNEYFRNGLIDSSRIQSRHDELVAEMTRRGFAHWTPLKYEDTYQDGYVDEYVSMLSLFDRCDSCRARIMEWVSEGSVGDVPGRRNVVR